MERWLKFMTAAAVAIAASGLFWRWMGSEAVLPDVPGARLQCLSYTPFEPRLVGYHPQGIVSRERIESDLAALAPLTGCVRIYSALEPAGDIVAAAGRRGLRVLLGAWIGGRTQQEHNRRQIEAALDLAHRHRGTVMAIVVGNEVLLRREMTASELATLIRDVRARSPVPVAYADVDQFIRDNPEVADAVDLAMIHVLPYWIDPVAPSVDEVLPYIERRAAEFRTKFPGKDFMIGETGWPSAGRRRGQAQPGLINEARLVRTFANRAATLGLRYNLIEAIDQPWKRIHEGTVGGYWGVLDQYRRPKFSLAGPVSEWPRWRLAWLVSITGSCLVLLAAARRRVSGTGRWGALAVLASGMGMGLPLQWDFVMTTSQTVPDWVIRITGMLASLVATSLLVDRLAGSTGVIPATMSETWRALRHPLRLVRGTPLRIGLLQSVVLPAAAYIGINLALAPRHLDIPTILFALPALALAAGTAAPATNAGDDRREEALLGTIILVSGLLQTEASDPWTWSWTAIGCLLFFSQRRAIGAELRRLRRQVFAPDQA